MATGVTSCDHGRVKALLVGLGVTLSMACSGREPQRDQAATAAAPGGRGECDQADLAAAATAADTMLKAWSPASGAMPDYRLAARGIQQACPYLPAGFVSYFQFALYPLPDLSAMPLMGFGTPVWQDLEAMRPLRAHCPEYDKFTAAGAETIYKGCGFAGLGLIDRDQLPANPDGAGQYGHALYLWLLDDGAPPEVARALVRPILAGTSESLFVVTDLMHLPAAPRGAAPTGGFVPNVQLALDGVTFADKREVTLESGHLPAGDPLDLLRFSFADELQQTRLLASPGDGPPRLLFTADRQLPWATLVAVARAAREAGYVQLDTYAFGPAPRLPMLTLSLLAVGPPPTLELALTGDAIVLRCKGGEHSPALSGLSAALDGCGGGSLRLIVAPDSRWQQVIMVLAELAGHAMITELASPA